MVVMPAQAGIQSSSDRASVITSSLVVWIAAPPLDYRPNEHDGCSSAVEGPVRPIVPQEHMTLTFS